MINCKNCVKNDVCGVRTKVSEHIESLSVDYNLQQLKLLGIDVSMDCKYFLANSHPKILGGGQ